ncbi:Pleckstrin-likey domain-containing family M member 3, partial [Cucurbita argyrosperma subsp. argyrosperma]
MINGDGHCEGFSEVASADPLDSSSPWGVENVDGCSVASSASSRYSSCGDSEFERYCSANSAMGTPSMRSTITVFNDCIDSEFAYARNYGFSDDGGLENFILGGNEMNSMDTNIVGYRKIELHDEITREEPSTKHRSSGLNLYGTGELIDSLEANGEGLCWKVESTSDLLCGVDMTNRSEKVESSKDEKEGFIIGTEASESGTEVDAVLGDVTNEAVHMGCLEGSTVGIGMKIGQRFEERLLPCRVEKKSDGELDVENDRSQNEHSESEDSMYNFLSDGDHRDEAFLHNNARILPETDMANENPLLINSSVALGSDDWNDFADALQERIPCNLNSSSLTVNGVLDGSGMTREDGKQMLLACKEDQASTNFLKKVNCSSGDCMIVPTAERANDVIQVRDIPMAICQVQSFDELEEIANNTFLTAADFSYGVELDQDAKDIFVVNNQAGDADKTAYNSECLVCNVSGVGTGAEKFTSKQHMCTVDGNSVTQPQILETEDNGGAVNQGLDSQGLGNVKTKMDPLGAALTNRLSTHASDCSEDLAHSNSIPESKGHLLPVELAKLELHDFYDEVVHEMEEILLESCDSPGARFTNKYKISQSLPSLPLRDGGSTTPTSGTNSSDPSNPENLKIDGVEVIGARQKRGDVSFSERLVGVKEYTVYKIRVWSDKKQWEVERRYRDFYSLYCQLKSSFADHGWSLPSPWSAVDNRSRKLFGSASPDIIAERSVLIQECLCSILHSRFSSTNPSPLIWFLSSQESNSSSPTSDTAVPQSPDTASVSDTQNLFSLGNSISLIVEIRPYKSTKQILEMQHYMCAGCYRHFDDQKTLMKGFVQSFGWGKPRVCDYTSQMFCSSCHTNEMAVIPARVLHHWDFTQYPVSQLAKSYLDSIHDQPMLCVSAVNPSLISKVPALLHVMGMRKKIGDMISYVRCPFRRSINRGLGFRRYLVESNDFFALRDLVDLSKGAFAVLPTILETISRKILEHIEEKCLVCCDAGVSCGARQACSTPLSLIFPFQETEMDKCASCESLFHKPCFVKLTKCHCGTRLRVDETGRLAREVGRGLGTDGEENGGVYSFLGKSTSISPLRSLSGLFAKEHKDSENIIVMGSLPSTSL